jgi:hypothetical protein
MLSELPLLAMSRCFKSTKAGSASCNAYCYSSYNLCRRKPRKLDQFLVSYTVLETLVAKTRKFYLFWVMEEVLQRSVNVAL